MRVRGSVSIKLFNDLWCKFWVYGLIFVGILIFLSPVAFAQSPDIVVAIPGQNVTVWKGWNVSGKVYLHIDGGPGADCIKLWWIRLGINSDNWEVCDKAHVEFRLPLIYGELRAGHFKRKTAIAVSDDANVAYTQELCGKVISC